ncbi:MAG: DNA-formamidopyrimidine glycosylase [Candidatus Omnitrophota bacterium]|nr:DNA-formamidopyrimidine glycosylase [Candidatus Omnitrophota bacterium]
MPELPEVETIKKGLEKFILNKSIKKVKVSEPRIVKSPGLKEFKRQLRGKTFQKIIRKGKYLIFQVSSRKFLIIHLKLTGRLIYGQNDIKSRLNFLLSDNNYLNLNSRRLFTEVRLAADYKKFPGIAKLGFEPLSEDFSLDAFSRGIKNTKRKIKIILMDQTFIAGIGNIYAQEALFQAKIDPRREACSLNKQQVKKLHLALKKILKDAVKYRGSSVNNYTDSRGEKGSFHLRLKVYGRRGEKCFSCGTSLKRISLEGRTTCFCPKCQK